jgi:hypothetical protein
MKDNVEFYPKCEHASQNAVWIRYEDGLAPQIFIPEGPGGVYTLSKAKISVMCSSCFAKRQAETRCSLEQISLPWQRSS